VAKLVLVAKEARHSWMLNDVRSMLLVFQELVPCEVMLNRTWIETGPNACNFRVRVTQTSDRPVVTFRTLALLVVLLRVAMVLLLVRLGNSNRIRVGVRR
jgi:fumarate reductase subunit C